MRSHRSLQVLEAYRQRILRIRDGLLSRTKIAWPLSMETVNNEWVNRQAVLVEMGQIEAVRVSSAFLSAFLSTELAERVHATIQDPRDYAGRFPDGRLLADALRSPVIGALGLRKEGAPEDQALAEGENRATRMAERAMMHAARESLRIGMAEDDRVVGWQRSVKGTCGACLGDIEVFVPTEEPERSLNVHPYCQCVTVPVVVGVPQNVALPSGNEIFARMSPAEQDIEFGQDKADALRKGDLSLGDLVATDRVHTPAGRPDDFVITERSMEAADPGGQ